MDPILSSSQSNQLNVEVLPNRVSDESCRYVTVFPDGGRASIIPAYDGRYHEVAFIPQEETPEYGVYYFRKENVGQYDILDSCHTFCLLGARTGDFQEFFENTRSRNRTTIEKTEKEVGVTISIEKGQLLYNLVLPRGERISATRIGSDRGGNFEGTILHLYDKENHESVLSVDMKGMSQKDIAKVLLAFRTFTKMEMFPTDILSFIGKINSKRKK